MKTKLITYIISLCAVICACSCLRDDIPYPRIQANITYISALEELRKAEIDSAKRVVTFYFPEETDIYNVMIDSLSLSPNTIVASENLRADSAIDLSSKYYVTLSMYQDYLWTLTANQEIERYFTVEGQIGTSIIDVPGHRVIAQINMNSPLNAVRVLSCKLGPSSAVTTPNLEGLVVDFTNPIVLNIENHGHYQQWTIYLEQTAVNVTTVRVDAWTKVAWVYGTAQADKDNYVEYRIKGDEQWQRVPEAWLTHNGGDFYARITGLSPLVTYEARAVSDDEFGQTMEFTMGTVVQLPNSNFDEWWLDGKVWDPWAEGGVPFWDTGNRGAATLGASNSVPTDDTVNGKGQAAMLETKFVGIGTLGKLAAGNIFIGEFLRVDGTNGILSFGREFTERPTKLKGYLKYKTAPISNTTAEYDYMKGLPDTCSVWVALTDTPEPFEIRTNPNNRQLFDPNGDYVVAYGRFQSGDDIPEYTAFEVEFEYRATDRVPRYIMVAASASKYGDFFTGASGAVLYVDEFELDYDY